MTQPEFGLVALLPMKAHSERVSGKNFRVFAGKPLFRWVLDTLLSLDMIDKVVINTDARENLETHGVFDDERLLIRDRAQDLCGDTVSMNRIIASDLECVSSKTYMMTHTTNPLLSSTTILKALQTYQQAIAVGDFDSLFSVNRVQTRFYRADGSPVNHDSGKLLRTQDLEAWFEENSNLYLFSRNSFGKMESRIGARPVLFETPRMESFDIDDIEGWDLAEIVATHLNS